jgi:hypothetical protein
MKLVDVSKLNNSDNFRIVYNQQTGEVCIKAPKGTFSDDQIRLGKKFYEDILAVPNWLSYSSFVIKKLSYKRNKECNRELNKIANQIEENLNDYQKIVEKYLINIDEIEII